MCYVMVGTVTHLSRAPIALRGVALAAALSVVAAGTGLPMCFGLLAQAAAPCAMHSPPHGGPAGAHATHGAALVATVEGHACHPDAAGLGCAAGSACPSGGAATPVWAKLPVALRAASSVAMPGPVAALVSYLAPPPAPPPQA